MSVQHLTKAEFIELVADYLSSPSEWHFKGNKPAVIDFYASWCGPCRALAPVIEELARDYEGRVDFYKVDTEQEQELSASFGIRSIPSILLCPMSGSPQMAQGAMPKQEFVKAIDTVLFNK